VKIVLSLVVTSLALAPAASAQTATVPSTTPPPAEDAALTAKVESGLTYKGRSYVLKGDSVKVTGTLKPYVAGQKVLVELLRKGRKLSQDTVDVRSGGAFTARVRARKDGALAIRVTHKYTRAQKRTTTRVPLSAIVPSAHIGSHGAKVRLLEKGLARLGYVTGRSSHFGAATARAVIAFRKVNKMARTTSAKKKIFRMLFAGKGGFKLRYPSAGPNGKHVEFDWSRQVLVLARGGEAQRIYHASSGKPSTPTVFGTFHFNRRQAGTNHLGMVWTTYFYGGYAIHGYHSVPTYAASHGCIRVPIPNSHSIYRWLNLGDTIFVYH
jgi:peptidoglycan hydrolase-like protein with peptidoglycan-binding domain